MGGLSGMTFSARRGRIIKTGQTVQYSGELDDGFYQRGLAKSYSVLAAGQYAGTTNIDLAHYTSAPGAITCTAATQTIADAGLGLAIFQTGDIILTNDPLNPGPFTIAAGGVAGSIVVVAGLVNSAPAGAITISKREAHSNNCVLDNNTGLMWSRYAAGKMGAASNGKMPWTGQLYDIFAYAAAANAANLAGYADWRVPNINEILSLLVHVPPFIALDGTAFPGAPANGPGWSSTTAASTVANALHSDGGSEVPGGSAVKTAAKNVILVRGGA